jgi:L-fucose mutarotase
LIAVTFAPMLKHLPALLTPDLLHALASLGHGDEVVIVDAHFPAASLANRHGARLLRVPGADTPQLLRDVLAVLPLDQPAPAAWTMQTIDPAMATPPAVQAVQALLAELGEAPPASLERFAFYERAARGFAIIQCGESRVYGNVLLRAGVWTGEAQ